MSNYRCVGALANQVTVGHERVNGTGQVYLDADAVRFLTNEEAIELGVALIQQAKLAGDRQMELNG